MELLLANPRGFCAGVERAIGTVEALLRNMGAPVHVRHEIVHNRRVVDRLASEGAVFAETTQEIPAGAVAVLSAHGVPPAVHAEAEKRRLRVVDATCPLVTRVQLEVVRQAAAGRSVIVIGHRGHVEVEGIVGHFPPHAPGVIAVIETADEVDTLRIPDEDAVAYVTQTTLAVDEARRIVDRLRSRFPRLSDPRADTICYATQNRQNAVRSIAAECELLLVIGAPHSSNSNRLVEVGNECGTRAVLIESAGDLRPEMFSGVDRVGLTASASAPEDLVQGVVDWLRQLDRELTVREVGTPEDLHFNLPPQARLRKEGTSHGDR